MDLGIIGVVKKLFRRVLVYILIFIIVGLLLNWGFLLFFGTTIWGYDRPGGGGMEFLMAGGITLMLLVIFPLMYFLLFKGGYFETVVGLVWHEYRDDLVNGVISHSSHMIITNYDQVKGDADALHTKMDTWFDDAPFWSKLVVNYLQKKLPLVDQLIEIVSRLDDGAFSDEETLQKTIKQEIQPYLQRTDVETEGGLYRIMKIIMVNVIILVCLYLILFYL